MKTGRLIGIVLIVVVGLVVVTAVGGYLYLQHLSPYAPYLAGTRALAFAQRLEETVENRPAYQPPTDSRLSDDQIARFVKVEGQVQAAIAAREAMMQHASDELQRLDSLPGGLTIRPALKEVGNVGSPFFDAKRAQVEALRTTQFAKDEYEWVRRQLYAAAGIELVQLNLHDMASFTSTDEIVRLKRYTPGAAPPENRRRAAEHIPNLRLWRPMAFFGL